MSKRIKELFGNILGNKAYENADRINLEGNSAFELSDEDLFLQTLLTNTYTDVFYANKDELAAESFNVHKNMLGKNPEFYAKSVIYARNKGFMRLQPVLGTVFLSTLNDKRYFKSVFSRTILTPNDLEDFLDICRSKSVRTGIGRSVKGEIIRYLKNNLTEYYAMKYKSALRDAIRLSRPSSKAFEGMKKDIVEYIMNNNVSKKLEKISAIERLKSLDVDSDKDEIISLIEKGKLPYEAVVGVISPTRRIWEALLYQMPIMATMRHINVMVRNKVFISGKAVKYVCEKLVNIKQSKILPFRLLTALNSIEPDAPEKIKDALRDGLENSFVNMPELEGKTCIAVDVSGSMMSSSAKTSMKPIQIAAIFSAAIMKKCDDCIVLPVDTMLHEHTCSRRDSIMTNAEKLMKLGGGGTELDLPLDYLIQRKIRVDNFICITDSEEWYRDRRLFGIGNRGFYNKLLMYKKNINRNVKVFFIRVMPHRDSTVPKHESNLYNIEGWSNTVIDFIATITKNKEDQKQAIMKTEL